MPYRAALFFPIAVLGWGCATASRGSSEILQIATVPPGASVSLSTGAQCTSPCEIEVKRRGPLSVTASFGGCESATVYVASEVDRAGGWTLAGYGALFLGGLVYENTKEVAAEVGSAIGTAIACTPVRIVGGEPEDCPRVEVKEDANLWVPILVAGIPAGVDLATGALNARHPNPLMIELDCVEASPSPDEGPS